MEKGEAWLFSVEIFIKYSNDIQIFGAVEWEERPGGMICVYKTIVCFSLFPEVLSFELRPFSTAIHRVNQNVFLCALQNRNSSRHIVKSVREVNLMMDITTANGKIYTGIRAL